MDICFSVQHTIDAMESISPSPCVFDVKMAMASQARLSRALFQSINQRTDDANVQIAVNSRDPTLGRLGTQRGVFWPYFRSLWPNRFGSFASWLFWRLTCFSTLNGLKILSDYRETRHWFETLRPFISMFLKQNEPCFELDLLFVMISIRNSGH